MEKKKSHVNTVIIYSHICISVNISGVLTLLEMKILKERPVTHFTSPSVFNRRTNC